MMMMMMTANQCPRVSGNNAIGCEKFTDASTRNCTLAIIFVRFSRHHHHFWRNLHCQCRCHCHHHCELGVCLSFQLDKYQWCLELTSFYTFLYLYRVKGKHVLIHAHISPLWYIWARCTLSMIKYLVLGICVQKLFIGIATLCTAFWLTHKSDSLWFVAERFKCCVIIDNTFDLVQYDLAKYYVWISKPSLPPPPTCHSL